MIITFCGHADTQLSSTERATLIRWLRQHLSVAPDCEFYLGGYGAFDELCRYELDKLRTDFPLLRTVFVTPYLDPAYAKLKHERTRYDAIVYPPIEHTPKRLAILIRNRWMVDQADALIACVRHGWGGAAQTLSYAHAKAIPIQNLAPYCL